MNGETNQLRDDNTASTGRRGDGVEKYATWMYLGLLASYFFLVLLLLSISVFNVVADLYQHNFEIQPPTLWFLFGSAGMAAFGLVLAVATGLFRPSR